MSTNKQTFKPLQEGLIERKEFGRCIELIESEKSFIICGSAGYGKSGCTEAVLNYCERKSMPYIATQFRCWATERLKEYMIKGFTMDDERLKNLGGRNYWKELLDRIWDIRSSKKVMYRQVLDLYVTSMD